MCRYVYAFFAFTIPLLVGAQGFAVLNDTVTLEINPRIVEPRSKAIFSLNSSTIDINRVQSSVSVNNVLVKQAIGLKQFTILTPRVGESVEVQLVIRTINQGTIEKKVTIRPAQVDLLYEAVDAHVPIGYKGKKLPAHQQEVMVMALPYFIDANSKQIDHTSLIYRWDVNGQVQRDQSGYGKNIFLFSGPSFYRLQEVSVQVENVQGDLVAQRKIDIPAYPTAIRFYPEHPLSGIDMSRAITSQQVYDLEVPELAVHAVPFYFSNPDSLEQVQYEWTMNGSPLSTFGDRNIVNLRAPEGESGWANVRLQVKHVKKLFQNAEANFNVLFGNSSGTRGGNRNTPSRDFFGNNN